MQSTAIDRNIAGSLQVQRSGLIRRVPYDQEPNSVSLKSGGLFIADNDLKLWHSAQPNRSRKYRKKRNVSLDAVFAQPDFQSSKT